jgi:23S rRNA (pseudouridine1915-N3)-methyltransferase
MREIIIIAVGRIKNDFFAGAIAEYSKRLKPYASVKILELTPESFSESTRVKAKGAEGERILKNLEKFTGAEILLLHERGRELDSVRFSEKLSAANGKIIFVIAGALGFSDEVLVKYPQISLSEMTFPHELARLVLLEQIYRAATIIKGKTYHY